MGNHENEVRWILGFDGNCAACTGLARQIEALSAGRLTTRSLWDPEIRVWRERTLGDEAPWLPTLFMVEDGHVRAWVRAGLATRLTRLVGAARAVRIAGLLTNTAGSGDGPGDPSRRRFLKIAGGATVAVSLLYGLKPLVASAAATGDAAPHAEPLASGALQGAIEQLHREPEAGRLWATLVAEGFTPDLAQAQGVRVVAPSRISQPQGRAVTIPFAAKDGRAAELRHVALPKGTQVGIGTLSAGTGIRRRIDIREVRDGRVVPTGAVVARDDGSVSLLTPDGRVLSTMRVPVDTAVGSGPDVTPFASSGGCTVCHELYNAFLNLSCGLGGFFACNAACALIGEFLCPFICAGVFIIYCGGFVDGAALGADAVCQGYC